jgi:hypothetical protein
MSWDTIHQSLSAGSWFTAYHADGLQLIHTLRLSHEDRHWAKRFATEIGIQTSDNDPQGAVCKQLGDPDDLIVKELRFIIRYYGSLILKQLQAMG